MIDTLVGKVATTGNLFTTSNKVKVAYHTYLLPSEGSIKIVIKRLPTKITNEELAEELSAIVLTRNENTSDIY